MNRRAFLKTLSALGVGTATPLDLDAATAEEVDAAWREVTARWDLFVVSDAGTLSYPDVPEPRTRREAGEFGAADTINVNDVECYQTLHWRIQLLYAGRLEEEARARGETPDFDELFDKAEEPCLAWFTRATGDEREDILREIEDWLEEEPDWEGEWEDFYTQSDAQGLAYQHFLTEDPEVREALDIVIVEGDHPGSSYFAAELHSDVDEANRVAEARGWAIRFVPESDVPV